MTQPPVSRASGNEILAPDAPAASRAPSPAGSRAPNRLLDLEELKRPDFAGILEAMDRLVAADGISYLHPSKRWEYPWALERARLPPGARVLDAGCGDSIFPVYLASRGFSVVGADLEMSGRLGALHGVDLDYVRGDLTALPFAGASFDAVFCISVIEHLPRDRIAAALDELRRVLRPEGKLLLTTDYYEDADARLWYEGPGDSFPVEWGFFDEKRLRELLLGHPGLRVEGEIDLAADWDAIRPRMKAFHGYPYTSVGVALTRER